MDYPNMSYCAAENTMRAVDQLIDLIESGEKNDEQRSGYEYHAMKSLAEIATTLAELCAETVEYIDNHQDEDEDE